MLGVRATRSADRSTRSRRPLPRDQSVSPPRVASKKKSPAREPEEASRIEEKLEEKRTQLYDLLRSEQWSHTGAEEEVLRWQMTACVRRTGSWKGGIDLSYRHQVRRGYRRDPMPARSPSTFASGFHPLVANFTLGLIVSGCDLPVGYCWPRLCRLRCWPRTFGQYFWRAPCGHGSVLWPADGRTGNIRELFFSSLALQSRRCM